LKEENSQLIVRALEGDQRAYESLMKRYHHGIYVMIYQMIKNREETEDLVQETFMKAFHALENYNNQFAFSTWLYKIAYNNCIDAIRKRKLKTQPIDRPIQHADGESVQELRDDTTSPEKDFLYAEKQKFIQDAVDSLPEIYREVIRLRHQEERSYEEISERLGLPIGTVKARIFRAREVLKQKLREV
jgi:RNA polymerase sigma-70 factor (ECF subfamily)